MIGSILVILVIIGVGALLFSHKQKSAIVKELPANVAGLLEENVPFYKDLDEAAKKQFVVRVKDFLQSVTIRGVDVQADDLDKVLVAAGAIILIFSFPDWKYTNISEVLLYKGSFSREFSTEDGERNVLGMVGDGAMHREMVLSQPSLRASFANAKDGHNTVLHEFAHLIDKADGAVDGTPDYLLGRNYLQPWVDLVRRTIAQMKSTGKSDIDRYGATNEAEFFAVVTEYFFERPLSLQEHHPELFDLLTRMFHPEQIADGQ